MEQPEYESMYEMEDSNWWFVGRRKLALTLIDQWVKFSANPCILDVGCGTGSNAKALTQYGRVMGLDLSGIALSLAYRRQAGQLFQGSSMALPYANNTIELITIFDVLYHRWITDDVHTIAELYRVLKPGGWLLITDSALPFLWSSHDDVYYARQRYTLSDLTEKLNTVGFVQKVCSYNNMLLLPMFLFVRLTMNWLPLSKDIKQQGELPGWLNKLLINIRYLEAMWLRRGGTLPIGSSLICLSQKPKGDTLLERSF